MRTPDRRQAMSGAGEQLHLIESPPFSPKYPNSCTLSDVLIRASLQGKTPAHRNFEGQTSLVATGRVRPSDTELEKLSAWGVR